MLDPNLKRGNRMREFEQNRQRMEKQGTYKAPDFMLYGILGLFALVVLILIAMFVLHLF